jgi:potassium channel subfamily K
MAPANDRKESGDSQTLTNRRTHSHISGKEYIGRDLGEDEKKYYQPSHIWYAATVFPLVAGSFGPLGLAFSICALIEDWRVTIPSSGQEADEVFISDPKW